MSTDLFGARVLDVDPARREVCFRVFAVYYDTSVRQHLSPPERDPGFFLGLLWETGRWDHPIGATVSVDQILDRDWTMRNARWFVEHVERVAVRNDPPPEDAWDRLHDFYYERDGGWKDEDLLVQADYVVRATDPCWIEHLHPGDAWGTAWYPSNTDNPRTEDLPRLPDLHAPAVLTPFGGERADSLAFSDDGRFLAVTNDDGELVVYDCDGWSEHARSDVGTGLFFPRPMWVPGRHVITLREPGEEVQKAYDADARAEVEAPAQRGNARSRTGRYRVEYGEDYGLDLLVDGGERVRVRPAEELTIEAAAFTADETRLFVGGMGPDVHVIDPSSGTVVDTHAGVVARVTGLAVSPDGAYLVVCGSPDEQTDEDEITVLRLADRTPVMRRRVGGYVAALAWTDRWLAVNVEHEDGGGETRIMPTGLPERPPEDLRPPHAQPRATEAGTELDHELVLGLADVEPPLTRADFMTAAADHGRWLAAGGGGTEGNPWQVVVAAGVPLPVYTGSSGSDGVQADLRNRRIENGADLRGLVLPWSALTAVVGENVVLSGADLRGATVTDARLPGADLRGADLRDADFSRSDLTGADLTGANLTGTDFEDARLDGARGLPTRP